MPNSVSSAGRRTCRSRDEIGAVAHVARAGRLVDRTAGGRADGDGTVGVPAAVVSTADDAVVLGAEDVLTFGRSPVVDLRIGHAPVDDAVVPRVTGALFALDGRVVVANHGTCLAFDLAVPGRALLSLAPGDWHAPADPAFTVVVQGTLRYEMGVTANVDRRVVTVLGHGEPDPGPPPDCVPDLSERQRAILDAYVAPMAEGLPSATHQQVADALGCSRQTVRLECNRIWGKLLMAGVPMRDLPDARDAIADAWARHRF